MIRHLPRGSMRRQLLRRGRIEGSVATLALVCLLGFGTIAATPPELYMPAPATVRPTPEGGPATVHFANMPPCGPGKDCSELDHDGAIVMLPRAGPLPGSHSQQHTAGRVPEPGTLALLCAGLVALARRPK